ncbi:MAG: phenylalanine--tRNA ligase subunit beta [Pseudomonadota bacterium]
MKVSFQWLKDYIEFSLTPPELAETLTHIGLEVENLNEWQPVFQGIIVARMVSIHRHPQSDHLSICTVNDGQRDYSVVCGAPNLKVGERVALALEGSVLPDGGKISRSYFHGVLSEGMLCSEKELGLSEDAAGIMVLDPNLPLGVPLEKAAGLQDWVLDVNITPNRADCLCLLGVAREVSALTGKPLRYPSPKEMDGKVDEGSGTTVTLERPDLCPRYVAQLILGVKIAPSPFWMRRRLEAVGVRSINNIVDVTNYVMLEMGQPLHAFDLDRLAEKRIVVRTAAPGEKFTTLDGMERTLPKEALMICDGKKPVALAGIMGGLNSEVQTESKNILLESAYFDPMGIRRTCKRISLATEASLRFERGIDPNGSLRAANRAAALMAELAGGKMAREAADNYPCKIEPQNIFLRAQRVNKILGTAIAPQKIQSYLQNFHLQVESENSDTFRVMIPTYRVDLQREIDLVEEVARLHGYLRIPVTLPSGRVSAEKKTKMRRAAERARDLFIACGFREVITYSFISPQALQDMKLFPPDKRAQALRIHNPLSEDQSVMRTTLIPGLLQVARNNIHRQNLDLKLFELGRVFSPRDDQELPEEIETLSGFLAGLREEESWSKPKAECDFFDLKGTLETLLDGLGVSGYRFLALQDEPFFQAGKSCQVEMNGKVLGEMGELHPDVSETWELGQQIFIFELNFQALAEEAEARQFFKPLARFPAIIRDLALVVDEKIAAGDILQTLWEADNGLITEIKLFDLYRGKPVPPGRKSLAFRLKYQEEDRTLTDREVNQLHQKVADLLVERYGGTLR